MSIAIYPGSFDPMTKGHIHIAERACRIFDQVVIGVAVPNYKTSMFSLEERLEFLKEGTAHIPNCRVQVFDCLTVEFAKSVGATAIIRGLRAISDYEYEMQVAAINKYLDEGIETVFLLANSEYSFLSSSIIKQVVRAGGQVTGLVTPKVEEALTAKFRAGKLKATENI